MMEPIHCGGYGENDEVGREGAVAGVTVVALVKATYLYALRARYGGDAHT